MNRAGGLPRWLGRGVALVGVALVATLVAALPAAAGTVTVYDDSKVLNQTTVYNEAAKLHDPVSVYTTTNLASDPAAFDRHAQSKVQSQDAIVIAINTQSKHLAIRTGPKSRVTQAEAKTASDKFTSTFKGNSDYTAATVAALGSLNSATQSSHNSGGSGFGVVPLIVGILVVAIIVVVIVGLMRRRSRSAPVYQQPAGYPAPGYGAPGYGPAGYGPPVGGSGISPMAAGGIGAVAGGVLGYELGKMEGERHEEYREGHHGDYGDGGNYGGGGYGGGGADADFGGGGDSGGGGGDNF